MKNSTNNVTPKLSKALSRACTVSVLSIFSQFALAQSDSTQLGRVDLTFNPSVVQINTPNTITVSGIWNNGCVPQSGRLVESSYRVVITLQLPPANTLCTQALQPYQVVLPAKTFASAGSYELQVVTSEGAPLDGKTFAVQGAGQFFSEFNFAGGWFERTTSGSGLMISHKRAGAIDQLWGTWHNYTDAGKPTWFSLQGGRWNAARNNLGDIYETSANPSGCTLEFPGDPNCPIPFKPIPLTLIRKIGTYSLGFTSANSAQLTMRLDAGALVTRVINLERIQ